ncbi:hypothetical protein [Bradyrhizobium stylosanthis]|uniref:hypothetical protein n=1 Tax=Bradyrhizobium stylosanthis TaxID=1803665 RepID=UPI0011AACE97|nr:hypothetical protein [Bradyrhizobium stylosanthis]
MTKIVRFERRCYDASMPPLLVTLLNCALIGTFIAGMLGGVWANHQMLLRARDAGGRFWLINPLTAFAGITIKHALIFLACLAVSMASFAGLIALNQGLPKLKAVLFEIQAGPVKH